MLSHDRECFLIGRTEERRFNHYFTDDLELCHGCALKPWETTTDTHWSTHILAVQSTVPPAVPENAGPPTITPASQENTGSPMVTDGTHKVSSAPAMIKQLSKEMQEMEERMTEMRRLLDRLQADSA